MLKESYEIIDAAFQFPDEKVGCLLIHGFTGSPSEVKPLGEYLAQKGIGVYGVRLKGHGTAPEDLANTVWPHWYASAKQGLTYLVGKSSLTEGLKGKYDRIFVIGLSMGGLLALKLAAEFKVDGVVSINAPIFLSSKAAKLAPILKYFKDYYQKPSVSNFKNRFSYDRVPLKALASLLQLIKLIKKQVLPKVSCPVLVVQSKADKTVVPKSGDYIFKKLAVKEKQLVWLAKGGHIATLEEDQEQLFKHITNFLNDNQGER